MKNMPHRRQNIQKLFAEFGEKNIVIRPLDLYNLESQRELLAELSIWQKRGKLNHTVNLDYEATRNTIIQANSLGVEGIGLYIDDTLQSIGLYQLPGDKRYAILNHMKTNFIRPHMLDLILYKYAEWFASIEVQLVNIEMDWGIPMLRSLRMSIGPTDYLRKYTVTPAP